MKKRLKKKAARVIKIRVLLNVRDVVAALTDANRSMRRLHRSFLRLKMGDQV